MDALTNPFLLKWKSTMSRRLLKFGDDSYFAIIAINTRFFVPKFYTYTRGQPGEPSIVSCDTKLVFQGVWGWGWCPWDALSGKRRVWLINHELAGISYAEKHGFLLIKYKNYVFLLNNIPLFTTHGLKYLIRCQHWLPKQFFFKSDK